MWACYNESTEGGLWITPPITFPRRSFNYQQQERNRATGQYADVARSHSLTIRWLAGRDQKHAVLFKRKNKTSNTATLDQQTSRDIGNAGLTIACGGIISADVDYDCDAVLFVKGHVARAFRADIII